MGCNCHLKPTFEHLYGKLTPEFAAYLEELDPTKPGDPLFEEHMQVEEQYIAQFLTPADRQRLFFEHARFRRGDASGFAAHSKWEKATFAKLHRRTLSRPTKNRPTVAGRLRATQGAQRMWR